MGRKWHEMRSAEATVPWVSIEYNKNRGLSSKSIGKPLMEAVEAKDTISLALP